MRVTTLAVLFASACRTDGLKAVNTALVADTAGLEDTGAPVDFVTGVLLRVWITGVLGSFVLSWIGCLFWIIDSCMIFGQERRCLHDHIASTRVVEVPGRRGRGSSG